jgi:hypothetical protein
MGSAIYLLIDGKLAIMVTAYSLWAGLTDRSFYIIVSGKISYWLSIFVCLGFLFFFINFLLGIISTMYKLL